MKTAISIPDDTFREADALARQLGISRSQLYARAVEQFVEARRSESITERLNAVHDKQDSRLDPVVDALQLSALPHEDW